MKPLKSAPKSPAPAPALTVKPLSKMIKDELIAHIEAQDKRETTLKAQLLTAQEEAAKEAPTATEFTLEFPLADSLKCSVILHDLIIDGKKIPNEQALNSLKFGERQKLADYYAKYTAANCKGADDIRDNRNTAISEGVTCWAEGFWTISDQKKAERQAKKALEALNNVTADKWKVSSKVSISERRNSLIKGFLISQAEKANDEAGVKVMESIPVLTLLSSFNSAQPELFKKLYEKAEKQMEKEAQEAKAKLEKLKAKKEEEAKEVVKGIDFEALFS